jgi:hypothetical protein
VPQNTNNLAAVITPAPRSDPDRIDGKTRAEWQRIAENWWPDEMCEVEGCEQSAVYMTPKTQRFDCWEHALVDPDQRVDVFYDMIRNSWRARALQWFEETLQPN